MRRSRGLIALAAGLVLSFATACGGADADPDAAPSSRAPSGEPTSTPSNTTPVADPEHAVDPPGPRRGPIVAADMLVFSPENPLDKAKIRAIKGLKGVDRVEALSLGQAVIENRSVTVAAVDPASYRLFTPRASAEEQVVWDRVAGGELAIVSDLRNKLPTDEDGFVRLGSADDAPAVHIGAYAPQIESAVDAVVNEDLG